MFLSALLVFEGTVAMLAQAAPHPPAASVAASPTVKKAAVSSHGETPERVFQSNCGRCHYAPESLNSRITGTIVRHMRVRANLSAEEERMIRSYLNP